MIVVLHSKPQPIARAATPSGPPPVPYIDQADKFNDEVSESADYQKLLRLCRPRWDDEFTKRSEDDQDETVVDYAIDIEVATRSSEGWAKWDWQWQVKAGFKATGFAIDYIVGTAERKVGGPLPQDILIKYTDYPVPSWENRGSIKKNTIALEYCRSRCLDLDFIEVYLRAQYGDDNYIKTYPNRYLKREEGAGCGGYVKRKRSLYINRLRAIESRWLYICQRFGLPPIYIEDWTAEAEDDQTLALIEFLNYLLKSGFVENPVARFNQLEHVKCESGCGTCQSHNSASMRYECTDECDCDGECGNRDVQDGRQMALCVFRQAGKGWGLRTMSEIDCDDFITEFTGEVLLKGDRWATHDISMSHSVRDDQGERIYRNFVISAAVKGNESRFVNHSCVPNMKKMPTIVERFGLFYHHVALFADRDIIAGEELTVDYFSGQTTMDSRTVELFHGGCRCESCECRFPAPPVDEIEAWIDAEEEEEGGGDEEMGEDEKEDLMTEMWRKADKFVGDDGNAQMQMSSPRSISQERRVGGGRSPAARGKESAEKGLMKSDEEEKKGRKKGRGRKKTGMEGGEKGRRSTRRFPSAEDEEEKGTLAKKEFSRKTTSLSERGRKKDEEDLFGEISDTCEDEEENEKGKLAKKGPCGMMTRSNENGKKKDEQGSFGESSEDEDKEKGRLAKKEHSGRATRSNEKGKKKAEESSVGESSSEDEEEEKKEKGRLAKKGHSGRATRSNEKRKKKDEEDSTLESSDEEEQKKKEKGRLWKKEHSVKATRSNEKGKKKAEESSAGETSSEDEEEEKKEKGRYAKKGHSGRMTRSSGRGKKEEEAAKRRPTVKGTRSNEKGKKKIREVSSNESTSEDEEERKRKSGKLAKNKPFGKTISSNEKGRKKSGGKSFRESSSEDEEEKEKANRRRLRETPPSRKAVATGMARFDTKDGRVLSQEEKEEAYMRYCFKRFSPSTSSSTSEESEKEPPKAKKARARSRSRSPGPSRPSTSRGRRHFEESD